MLGVDKIESKPSIKEGGGGEEGEGEEEREMADGQDEEEDGNGRGGGGGGGAHVIVELKESPGPVISVGRRPDSSFNPKDTSDQPPPHNTYNNTTADIPDSSFNPKDTATANNQAHDTIVEDVAVSFNSKGTDERSHDRQHAHTRVTSVEGGDADGTGDYHNTVHAHLDSAATVAKARESFPGAIGISEPDSTATNRSSDAVLGGGKQGVVDLRELAGVQPNAEDTFVPSLGEEVV